MSELIAILLAHSWHQTGCKCGWVNPVDFDLGSVEDADLAHATHVAEAIEGGA